MKRIILATAFLSIGFSGAVDARGFMYTIECAWPNGDHWSQSTNNFETAVNMSVSCTSQGGSVSHQVKELTTAP